ncbi:hypothetical protein [Cellulomonas shaoxiangyii]|uniref:DUF5808 domain-containing protein n=1 Tax=Cellulomonas shaoxiangyii TaxID=2566013 RepID=A0A4P7SHD0_9CELL|nr:hypothetical protein [Cellulomonas shaoxiangyii]QCB93091.1 hypothetical protein E5225_05520 [Cellulomonas shaoxiangyii]TGY84879.1 hypothetical protein E5226_09295 [Cellulomonas shaoxiangyii]
MGSHDATSGRRGGLGRLLRVVSLGLAVAAVVKELRTPADRRQWHGTVAGVVPYDFRIPTPARVRARLWDPDAAHVIGPHVFGVGWSVNAGRVVALVRQRLAG